MSNFGLTFLNGSELIFLHASKFVSSTAIQHEQFYLHMVKYLTLLVLFPYIRMDSSTAIQH